MRLIDADAYADEMRKKQNNCRAWKDSLDRESETYARAEQSFVTFIEAALTLKNQPTVYAIPVEWLREKMKKPLITSANPFDYVLDAWEQDNNPSPTCGPDYCDID